MLPVDVMDPALPACEPSQGTVNPGDAVPNASAAASISLPAGADMPVSPSVVWSVSAFGASIDCADDIVPAGYDALGPAITFASTDPAGPSDKVFPRGIHLSVPINPVRLPEKAHWRHLRVAYSGPKFKKPRTIFVTDPRVEKVDGNWRPVVRGSATRHLPGGGRRAGGHAHQVAAAHPSRAHRRVDGRCGRRQFRHAPPPAVRLIAPMGGPVDWTWLMDHIEHNHMAGFRPIAPGTQLADIPIERATCDTDAECKADERCMGKTSSKPGRCTMLPPTDEPYEHASTFDTWWYEVNSIGNGGSFTREDMTQMLRDISLVFGNPNGYNPLSTQLPAGVDPNDPSVVGDHGDCALWVKPYDTGEMALNGHLNDLANRCAAERCNHTQVLKNYYDDEYNPDGTFDVITFCDGSPRDEEQSPYASTWSPIGNDKPMEVALAVDYNGNGKRDDLEPVIRAGHEPWSDVGTDGLPSSSEPGYDASTNPDPSGDDYDPQYNPTGTEGDQRWQPDEPFLDYGLDGVPNTASSPYDFGEGDGKFTVAPGLQHFWDLDPRSIVRGWSNEAEQPLDDDALSRIDVWTDGGIRDLFNFAVAARHFTGNFAARGRDAAMFSDFTQMPGQNASDPESFSPQMIVWDDLQGVVMQRYGIEDPNADQLEFGTGMHVGTISEITRRLQSALYFIGSRWRDAPHAQTETAQDKPAEGVDDCEIDGNCTFDFTSSFGRRGPVGVSFPPGYGHADLQDVRYPVIYMLHGYGMTPEDLQAAIVFLRNWMNGNSDSEYSRLAQAILVYVDGRCRYNENMPAGHEAECIRGNFYVNSVRPDGPQIDDWFLELMDYVDQRFRTMGESEVEWPQ